MPMWWARDSEAGARSGRRGHRWAEEAAEEEEEELLRWAASELMRPPPLLLSAEGERQHRLSHVYSSRASSAGRTPPMFGAATREP